ncbi:MAG: oligosaccharide flippase family protein [Pyrinomonadaceae bacterium]
MNVRSPMAAEIKSRKDRLARNSIFSLLSWAIPIVPAFIVTPIIVKGLGTEVYGVLVIILSFTTYFFAIGVGKLTTKFVAEYLAAGETEKIPDIISSAMILSLLLGTAGSGIAALFSRTIVTDVLLISPEYAESAVIGLYLACATILLTMISQVFQFVIMGFQRFDRYLLITNIGNLLWSAGSVLLVLYGYGLIALLVLNAATAAVVGIVSYLIFRSLLPQFRFTWRVNARSWNAVWRYGASILGYQLFGSVLLLFERGWIMRKFGPEALTHYSVPMALAIYIHLLVSSILLAVFPMFNELLQDRNKLTLLYQKSTKLILSIIVFLLVSSIACGFVFLQLWLSPAFAAASYWLLVIHVLTFSLLALSTIIWQVAESFDHARLNALTTFVWMAVSVPLIVVLSGSYGTYGAAAARLMGVLVFIPLLLFVEARFLGGVFWKFWGQVAWRVTLAAALTFALERIVLTNLPAVWGTLVAAVGLGGVLYLSVLMLTGLFSADEKQMLRNLFGRFGAVYPGAP